MRKGFRFPVNLSFLLMFVFLTSCADEADEGRKFCKRFGPLCQEAEEGKEGEIFLSVYGTSDVSAVNLSELGGSASAQTDGTRERIQPGTGKLYWTSNVTQHYLEVSVHANPGEPGKYALLIQPPGRGNQGQTRTYKLFLSGSYYSFVFPDE